MFNLQYILVNGVPTQEPDMVKWGRWMETANRQVRVDYWRGSAGAEYMLSTVFLGLDHNSGYASAPVLWETMLFTNGEGNECLRATSEAEAIRDHESMLLQHRIPPYELMTQQEYYQEVLQPAREKQKEFIAEYLQKRRAIQVEEEE